MLYLAVAVSCTSLCITLAAMGIIRAIGGGTVQGALGRSVKLMEWVVCAVQVQVVVSQSATAGLPPALQSLYSALRVFTFEGLGPPPACLAGGPFQSALSFFTVVTLAGGLLLLTWGVEWAQSVSVVARPLLSSGLRDDADHHSHHSHHSYFTAAGKGVADAAGQASDTRGGSSDGALFRLQSVVVSPLLRWCTLRNLQVLLLLTCVLLYPATANATIGVLQCSSQLVSVEAYRSMEGDGTTLTRLGIPVDVPSPLAALLQQLAETAPNSTTSASGFDGGGASGSTLISVAVLASNPMVVCYEGRHPLFVSWGWALVVLYLVGLPLGSVCWVTHALRSFLRRSLGRREWRDLCVAVAEQQHDWVAEGGSLLLSRAARTVAVWLCFVGKRGGSSHSLQSSARSPSLSSPRVLVGGRASAAAGAAAAPSRIGARDIGTAYTPGVRASGSRSGHFGVAALMHGRSNTTNGIPTGSSSTTHEDTTPPSPFLHLNPLSRHNRDAMSMRAVLSPASHTPRAGFSELPVATTSVFSPARVSTGGTIIYPSTPTPTPGEAVVVLDVDVQASTPPTGSGCGGLHADSSRKSGSRQSHAAVSTLLSYKPRPLLTARGVSVSAGGATEPHSSSRTAEIFSPANSHANAAPLHVVTPFSASLSTDSSSSSTSSTVDAVIDGVCAQHANRDWDVLSRRLLYAEFRPSAYWMFDVDILLLLLLCLAARVVVDGVGRLILVECGLLVAAGYYAVQRPYTRENSWMWWCK